jgi:hypothetical protein
MNTNTNITSNSRPLPRVVFTLILGAAAAMALWAIPATAYGQIFETNYFSATVGEYTTDGATLNDSLVTGLSIPFGIAVSAGSIFVANHESGTFNGAIG